MKKILYALALLPSIYSIAVAQVSEAILTIGGNSSPVYIHELNDKGLAYSLSEDAEELESVKRSEVQGIFFLRPQVFNDALESYYRGDLKDAQTGFEKTARFYSKVKNYKDSYPMVAAFYQAECARRLGNYDEMRALQRKVLPAYISNEVFLTQLQMNVFWEAYGSKDWNRMSQIYKAWENKKLTSQQRAQLQYCYGVSLIERGEMLKGRVALNSSLALNQLKEPELFAMAGKRLMDLALANEAVQEALATQQSDAPDKSSRAFRQLLEASAIAKIWDDQNFLIGEKLPEDYVFLLKIKRPELTSK